MKKLRKLIGSILIICMTIAFPFGQMTAFAAPTKDAAATFRDLTGTEKYYDSIQMLYEAGIMQGTSSQYYSPKNSLTRLQAVNVLYSAAGTPKTTYQRFYSDVSLFSTGVSAITWASKQGLIGGYNGTKQFRGSQAISAEDTVLMLYRALGSPAVQNADEVLSRYPDGQKISGEYRNAVAYLLLSKIADDMIDGGELSPSSGIAREVFAELLVRIHNAKNRDPETETTERPAQEAPPSAEEEVTETEAVTIPSEPPKSENTDVFIPEDTAKETEPAPEAETKPVQEAEDPSVQPSPEKETEKHDLQVPGSFIDVTARGADNTGKKDCSGLLKTLITENPGGTIYFPEGDYLFSTYCEVANGYNADISKWGITIKGAGADKTRFLLSGAYQNSHNSTKKTEPVGALTFENAEYTNVEDITFQSIDGRSQIAVMAGGKLERSGTYHGVSAIFHIRRCRFLNTKAVIFSSAYAYVDDCEFLSGEMKADEASLSFLPRNNDLHEYAYVRNCIFKGKRVTTGVSFDALQYGYVNNCIFEELKNGIFVQSTKANHGVFGYFINGNKLLNVLCGLKAAPGASDISRIFADANYYESSLDGCLVADLGRNASKNTAYNGYFEMTGTTVKGKDQTLKTYAKAADEAKAKNLVEMDIWSPDGAKILTGFDCRQRKINAIKLANGSVTDAATGRQLEEGRDYVVVTQGKSSCIYGVGSYTGSVSASAANHAESEAPAVYDMSKLLTAGMKSGKESVSELVRQIIEQQSDKGCVLTFPSGVYLFTAPLDIRSSGNGRVRIEGDTFAHTVFAFADCKGRNCINAEHLKEFTLKNIFPVYLEQIEGTPYYNKSFSPDGHLIYAKNVSHTRLEGIKVYGLMDPVFISDGDRLDVDGCMFSRPTEKETGTSLTVSNVKTVLIDRTAIDGNPAVKSGARTLSMKAGNALSLSEVKDARIVESDLCNWRKGSAVILRNSAISVDCVTFMRDLNAFSVAGNKNSIAIRSTAFWGDASLGTQMILSGNGTIDNFKIMSSYLMDKAQGVSSGIQLGRSDVRVYDQSGGKKMLSSEINNTCRFWIQ